MTKMYWRFPSNENILSRHPDAFLAATNCAMQVIHRRAAQGALMTVGWDQNGAPAEWLEPHARVGRRASGQSIKMGLPESRPDGFLLS
jgi:hypothetical protein